MEENCTDGSFYDRIKVMSSEYSAEKSIPRWMETFLRPPVKIAWKIYASCFFRSMAIVHWLKGEVPAYHLFYILLPNRLRPSPAAFHEHMAKRNKKR
ncbi:hypothetical protein M1413_00670 [Patescibacteria group bacterium]|nr:hypothetical protein [Patescibacteria group bacterium]MCL5114556.1 hypothetical protein [Patescibacteria group bacterium]